MSSKREVKPGRRVPETPFPVAMGYRGPRLGFGHPDGLGWPDLGDDVHELFREA